MPRLFSVLSVISVAAASIVDCGSTWPAHFAVDPPATVGAGQNVSMTATFDVPIGTPLITDGKIQIYGVASYLFEMEMVYSMCTYLTCPLTAGTYAWSWVEPFPADISGQIQMTFRLGPEVAGKQKPWLCLRWTAYATGSPSNATNSAIKWLYS